MEGTPAIYQGRILSQLDKDNFRAYIYTNDGKKKLVNSWNEFECHMESGVWFSALEETIKIEHPIDDNKKIRNSTKENKQEILMGYKK